ncbi:hypothetical protein ACS0TY_016168 [Phlomoides rotata]
MGTQERSRKKVHIWKKAILHFLLCFVMGFFTGFTPTSKSWTSSTHVTMSVATSDSPQPIEVFHQQNFNRSLLDDTETNHSSQKAIVPPGKLVIVITPTSRRNKLHNVLLRRLASTLKLVAQPLLWVVVEQKYDDSEVSEMLRKSGIMYRHVVSKENFSDADSEMDHQRNLALNHIEHHRLSGIVHFAGLSNVYDLSFFEEIRTIEAFGAWPIAKLSANRKKVKIEGPVCDSSEVMGWHLRRMKNTTMDSTTPPIHISSFAFNSSILWDPERWGRSSSIQDSSQNSLKYVREEVLEEETRLKGIPTQDCSKILLWDLHIPIEQ